MDSSREKAFYEALGAVPEVPAGILEGVERRVQRSGVKRRATLAACLLLAFIIPVTVYKTLNTSTAYADDHEAMDELFYAFEFLSGGCLDSDDPILDVVLADDTAGVGGAPLPAQTDKQLTKKDLGKKERSNEK
jgi:hypothetical protein